MGQPIFPPNLVAWKTPLTKQLLLTGEIGINKDLVDNCLNYPQFCLTVPDNMSRKGIIQEITKKGKLLLDASKGVTESCYTNTIKKDCLKGDKPFDTETIFNSTVSLPLPIDLNHHQSKVKDDPITYSPVSDCLDTSVSNSAQHFFF